MTIKDILTVDRCCYLKSEQSKESCLMMASTLLQGAMPQLTIEMIYQALHSREELGTTAMGHGVAIPHARMDGINSVIGAVIVLGKGAEFGAIDGKPVNLIFSVIVPTNAVEEHLQLLGKLAKFFSQAAHRDALRKMHSPESIYETIGELEAKLGVSSD